MKLHLRNSVQDLFKSEGVVVVQLVSSAIKMSNNTQGQ